MGVIEPARGQRWQKKGAVDRIFVIRERKARQARGEFQWTTGYTNGSILLTTLVKNYDYVDMDWKTLLWPYGEFWHEYEQKIEASVRALSLRELQDLKKACDDSDEHCWYAIYYSIRDVRTAVQQELYRRDHADPRPHHCGRMDEHPEHVWPPRTQRYACSGLRVREGGFRGSSARILI